MLQTSKSFRTTLLWYLSTAVIVSGLWTASDRLGLAGSALLLALVAILYALPDAPGSTEITEPRLLTRPQAAELALGIAIAAPLFAWIALYRADEFPFIGDHNVHLRHLTGAIECWSSAYLAALACLLLLLHRLRRMLPSWSPIAILALWLAAGVMVDPPGGYAVRYPGTLHFVAFPLAIAARALDLAPPLDALRIANALALPAWLFVLRPLVVKRWPDFAILPFAAFLFYQKETLYFFSSAYLEPWSLVMLALAVELLVCGDPRDGWKAVLAAFAAPMFKEYTILLASGVALSAWLRSSDAGARVRVALATTSGMSLFAFYYSVRLRAGVFGASGFDPEGVSAARFAYYGARALKQFGIALPLVVILVAALVWLATRPGITWRTYAPIVAALLAHNLYFFGEPLTTEWLANPRFQLPSLAFLAAPLLGLQYRPETTRRFLLVGAVIGALQLAAAVPLLALARQPVYELNFFEHRDAPVYLPFRNVVEEAEGRGWMRGATRLRALSNLHGVKRGYVPTSLPIAYPRIAATYEIAVEPLDPSTLERCACGSNDEAVVGLYVYFNEAAKPDAPVGMIQNAAAECQRRIATSCETSFALRYRGQLIGSFGRGTAAQSRP